MGTICNPARDGSAARARERKGSTSNLQEYTFKKNKQGKQAFNLALYLIFPWSHRHAESPVRCGTIRLHLHGSEGAHSKSYGIRGRGRNRPHKFFEPAR